LLKGKPVHPSEKQEKPCLSIDFHNSLFFGNHLIKITEGETAARAMPEHCLTLMGGGADLPAPASLNTQKSACFTKNKRYIRYS
jgi:hypothetical protein